MKTRLLAAFALSIPLISCDGTPTRTASESPSVVRLRLQPAEDLDTSIWNRTFSLSIRTTDDAGRTKHEWIGFSGSQPTSWALPIDMGQSILVHGLSDPSLESPETLWIASTDIPVDESSGDSIPPVILKARKFLSGGPVTPGRGVADVVLFSPTRESFVNPIVVRMATRTAGASIRYSLGTENPSISSPLAPDSILLDGTTTLTAIAYHPSLLPGEPVTRTFRFRVDSLHASRQDSVFHASIPVSIRWTTATRGAVLRYRTDGIDPDSSSPVLVGTLPIDASIRSIRLRGFRTGYEPSPVFRREYRIEEPTP